MRSRGRRARARGAPRGTRPTRGPDLTASSCLLAGRIGATGRRDLTDVELVRSRPRSSLARRSATVRCVRASRIPRRTQSGFGVDAGPVIHDVVDPNVSPSPIRRRIGDLFVEHGMITDQQLAEALDVQRRTGGRLGEILIELEFITSVDAAQILAERLGMPFVEPRRDAGRRDRRPAHPRGDRPPLPRDPDRGGGRRAAHRGRRPDRRVRARRPPGDHAPPGRPGRRRSRPAARGREPHLDAAEHGEPDRRRVGPRGRRAEPPPRDRRRGRADHPARRRDDRTGHRRARVRHPHRARRRQGADPLPRRRRAARRVVDAEERAASGRQPAQGDGRLRHLEQPHAAGRTVLGARPRPSRRRAPHHPADVGGRGRGAPAARQDPRHLRPRRARLRGRRARSATSSRSARRRARSSPRARPAPARRRRCTRRCASSTTPAAPS